MTMIDQDWAWRITWQGKTWTDEDLTGRHLATLALITGDDRFEDLRVDEDEIRAYPLLGHQRLMCLLSALVAVDTAETFDGDESEVAAALEEIAKAKADDILGCVEFNRR